jgi:alkylated DNA repair protein alkB family protein 8
VENPTEMEKKHVYEVYEKIAPHFSNTRYKPWPKIEKFLNEMEEGSLNLDVGCGNGKYLHVNSQKVVNVGTDRSFNLIGLAMEKYGGNQTFVCDSLSLPVRTGTFDSCISIAVVHHFSTKSLRIKAIREMARALRVGGRVLILVWAFEQENKKF